MIAAKVPAEFDIPAIVLFLLKNSHYVKAIKKTFQSHLLNFLPCRIPAY